MKLISSTKILGTKVSTARREKLVNFVTTRLKKSTEKFYIVTPNPEILTYAHSHKPYQTILNHAEVSLPDGIGVLMASKLFGNGIVERIPGVEFMEELTGRCAKEALTIGLFGGRANVAEQTAKCLLQKYPSLRIGFVGAEWNAKGFERAASIMKQESGIKDERKASNSKLSAISSVDLLFVALGAPKQEEWIEENLPQIPVTAAMGVGGAFDYISGRVKRAPGWVQSLGFEWLFRLIMQPWRWRRQLALVKFMGLVVRERLVSK